MNCPVLPYIVYQWYQIGLQLTPKRAILQELKKNQPNLKLMKSKIDILTHQFKVTTANLSIKRLDFDIVFINWRKLELFSFLNSISSTGMAILFPLTAAIFSNIRMASVFRFLLSSHLGDSGTKLKEIYEKCKSKCITNR